MDKCVNHPDRQTSYMCSKYEIYMCEECQECRDPKIYCKFRSACPIWYEHKRKERLKRKEEATDGDDSGCIPFLTDDNQVRLKTGIFE